MAVLTSPRRTRPRFGPQAGLVAAARGIAFTGLMLAGLGLLIVIGRQPAGPRRPGLPGRLTAAPIARRESRHA